jgi:hypothetical protein
MKPNFLTNALISVVILLSGWSLKETVAHGNVLASLVSRQEISDRDLLELRARVGATEAVVARVAADIAVMQARIGRSN